MSVRDDAVALGGDPDEAEALMMTESHGDPNAVSPTGAMGTMQVMPKTSAEMAKEVGPDKQKQGVGYWIKHRHDHEDAGPDEGLKFAAAGYNAGPAGVMRRRAHVAKRGGDPTNWDHVSPYFKKETQDYVPRFLKNLATVKARSAAAVTPGAGISSATETPPGDAAPQDEDAWLLNVQEKVDPQTAPVDTDTLRTTPERGVLGSVYDRTIGRTAQSAD